MTGSDNIHSPSQRFIYNWAGLGDKVAARLLSQWAKPLERPLRMCNFLKCKSLLLYTCNKNHSNAHMESRIQLLFIFSLSVACVWPRRRFQIEAINNKACNNFNRDKIERTWRRALSWRNNLSSSTKYVTHDHATRQERSLHLYKWARDHLDTVTQVRPAWNFSNAHFTRGIWNYSHSSGDLIV